MAASNRLSDQKREIPMEKLLKKPKTLHRSSSDLGIYMLIITDVVYGFIFWSIFQALAPMIWFYPLNELEISGYEVFAAVWLSPLFCLIPGTFSLLQNKWVLNLLRLVTVASVASFQAPSTLSRLVILSVGAGVSMLVLAATLWSPQKKLRYRTYWGLILGLHAFLAGRVWFVTFVPAWWDNTSNSVVIACGVISVFGYLFEETPPNEDDCTHSETASQPQSSESETADEPHKSKPTKSASTGEPHESKPTKSAATGEPHESKPTKSAATGEPRESKPTKSAATGEPHESKPTKSASTGEPHESKPTKQKMMDKPHWLPCGVGLGSILCLTHTCFGEASLVSRWTVKAFPNPGPVPLMWGSLVLLGLTTGSASLLARKQKYAILCVLAATACFFCMYLLPDPYLAFSAGCCLAFLTMLLWPVVVDIVTQSNPALCLPVASVTYIFQIMFYVWTVAFNFVPYGDYTREHTDWLILIIMTGILTLVVLYSCPSENYTVKIEDPSLPTFGMYVKVLVMILLAGQAGMLNRYLKYLPAPGIKFDSKVFTAGIWTFHFGYDNKGWPSMERAASLINDTRVDVLTLLESDASKPFLGNNDLATWLAEKLNFYVDFGPATKDHTWGNLILSRYPIVKSVHHLLPSPHGELAPAITASINISGSIVDFVVTHMGNDRDVLDRRLQARFLARELRKSPHPAVFLGYVTSEPRSENYNHLIEEGQVKDIDQSDIDRWCEYIMYKKLIRLGYARISHGGLSDTEVQLARFRIPQNPDNYVDNNLVTNRPQNYGIDKNVLFNQRFGQYYVGHGNFDDHRFHMSTPKYFYSLGKKKGSH